MPVRQIEYILDEMYKLFHDYPMTELNFETPFQCLVAVMLSAQTTDVQVNKATVNLFKKIKTPADIVKMWQTVFGQHIRTVGLRTWKAKNVVAMSQMLLDLTKTYERKDGVSLKRWIKKMAGKGAWKRKVYTSQEALYTDYWYLIPDTVAWLIALPWVGIKTAKVVLYLIYGQRHVAVDTHVHRVMNRLGVVRTKTPEQTSNQLETIIPDSYKDIAHKSIIYFGRYLCTAKNPQCDRCPLQKICPFYKNVVSKHAK